MGWAWVVVGLVRYHLFLYMVQVSTYSLECLLPLSSDIENIHLNFFTTKRNYNSMDIGSIPVKKKMSRAFDIFIFMKLQGVRLLDC